MKTNKTEPALHRAIIAVLGIAVSIFTLVEVNLAVFATPMTALSLFAMPMVAIVFLQYPLLERLRDVGWLRHVDKGLAAIAILCFTYIAFEANALTQRVGAFTTLDHFVGIVGLILVIEAARRATGWALPTLTIVFILFALNGPSLPDWLLPHPGESFQSLTEHAWLQTSSEGVFGIALGVMFRYVFLFVLFGGFLEATGATQFIVQFANRMFGRVPGGAAKIAVFSSGMLGSLSGSAVANTVTSGAFTIPMMKSSGFKSHEAAGIEAAASSGGALLPPVMGAGAYMMLETIGDQVSLTQILAAAVIPGVLYYISIFLLVHFHAYRAHAENAHKAGNHESGTTHTQSSTGPLPVYEGVMFVGSLTVLVILLLMGFSAFRAATFTIGLLLIGLICHPRVSVPKSQRIGLSAVALALIVPIYYVIPLVSRLPQTWANALLIDIALITLVAVAFPAWRPIVAKALIKASRTAATLVAAVCCVGIIIAIVLITGAGTALPAAVTPLAEHSLIGALLLIMGCSIVLGMGLPSAVCYLLIAILLGDLLSNLGVPLLAAHMFVFYFGMMSMVTPPVALAGYAAASIAEAGIIRSSFSAFRYALVGFTLPYMFVFRPELLLITGDEGSVLTIAYAAFIALIGITSLAAALAGYLFRTLSVWQRVILFAGAALALFPGRGTMNYAIDLIGALLLITIAIINKNNKRDKDGNHNNEPAPEDIASAEQAVA